MERQTGKYKELQLTGAETQEQKPLPEPVLGEENPNCPEEMLEVQWATLRVKNVRGTPQYCEIYIQELYQVPTVNSGENLLEYPTGEGKRAIFKMPEQSF